MTEIAPAVSLDFRAGDTLLLEFTVTRDGEPVNTTGMLGQFEVRRDANSEPVITTEGGDANAVLTVGLGDDGNKFRVRVEADVTRGLRDTYEFQARLIDGSDNEVTPSQGYLTWERSLIGAVS